MSAPDYRSFRPRFALIALLAGILAASAAPARAETNAPGATRDERVTSVRKTQTQPILVRKTWKKKLPTAYHRDPELSPEERKGLPRYAEINVVWLELQRTGQPELERTVNALLRERAGMPEDIEKMASDPIRDITSGVHRAFLRDGILSVAYKVYGYGHGAANGTTSIETVNFDLQRGKAIALTDLFPAASLPTLALHVQAELARMERGAWFAKIAPDNCFFFDRRALTLCFDQGAIDARALGVIQVALPWSRVASLLARNEATKRVLGSLEKKATTGAAPVSSR